MNESRRSGTSLLLIRLGCICFALAVAGAQTPPAGQSYASFAAQLPSSYLQSLQPPIGWINRLVRYGCGTAISADLSTVALLGLDKQTQRQAAVFFNRVDCPAGARYFPNEDGAVYNQAVDQSNALLWPCYAASDNVFLGDLVHQSLFDDVQEEFSNPDYNAFQNEFLRGCPICLSRDGSYILMGGWFTGQNRSALPPWTAVNVQGTGLLARRIDDGSYTFDSYLPLETNITDAVCDPDMNQVYVSYDAETINTFLGQAPNATTALTANFQRYLNTEYTVPRSQWFLTQQARYPTQFNRTLRLGLSNDLQLWAAATDTHAVSLFNVSNNQFFKLVNLATAAGPPASWNVLNVAIDYYGANVVVTLLGPNFAGERYVALVPFNFTAEAYAIDKLILLLDPRNTSFVTWAAGSSLSFAANPANQSLLVGLPGFARAKTLTPYQTQTGAAMTWIECVDVGLANRQWDYTGPNQLVNYTRWTPSYTQLWPFGSGSRSYGALGNSYTSHFVWSPQATFLVATAPMGGIGAGFLFRNPGPLCPGASPVAPPHALVVNDNNDWFFVGIFLMMFAIFFLVFLPALLIRLSK